MEFISWSYIFLYVFTTCCLST